MDEQTLMFTCGACHRVFPLHEVGWDALSNRICPACDARFVEMRMQADEAAEAEWYAHVMAQYDETRRESGYRPGQE